MVRGICHHEENIEKEGGKKTQAEFEISVAKKKKKKKKKKKRKKECMLCKTKVGVTGID